MVFNDIANEAFGCNDGSGSIEREAEVLETVPMGVSAPFCATLSAVSSS